MTHHGQTGIPGVYHPGQPYVHSSGPPPPVYKDYYTPACMTNGPPNGGSDAMCMAAVSVCKTQGHAGDLFMQHWRQQISPTVGTWEFVGSVCRGADDPVEQKPQITVEMVLDQAYAAAPKPTAVVQPGTRSYVNLPNNYYADAPTQTIPVVVLGQTIPVTFTVTDVQLGLRRRRQRHRHGHQGRRTPPARGHRARVRRPGQLRHHRHQR